MVQRIFESVLRGLKNRGEKMGVFQRMLHFLDGNSELEEIDYSEENTEQIGYGSNVVPMNQASKKTKKAKVSVMEPKISSDAKKVSDALLHGEIVIITLHRVDKEVALRIIDFVSGTAYAIDGNIERIRDELFLCTPASVEVAGLLPEITEVEQSLFD